jgi:hypothetical protein
MTTAETPQSSGKAAKSGQTQAIQKEKQPAAMRPAVSASLTKVRGE